MALRLHLTFFLRNMLMLNTHFLKSVTPSTLHYFNILHYGWYYLHISEYGINFP
jgi:hypothetical protein